MALMDRKFGSMAASGGTMSATRIPRKIALRNGTSMNTRAYAVVMARKTLMAAPMKVTTTLLKNTRASGTRSATAP